MFDPSLLNLEKMVWFGLESPTIWLQDCGLYVISIYGFSYLNSCVSWDCFLLNEKKLFGAEVQWSLYLSGNYLPTSNTTQPYNYNLFCTKNYIVRYLRLQLFIKIHVMHFAVWHFLTLFRSDSGRDARIMSTTPLGHKSESFANDSTSFGRSIFWSFCTPSVARMYSSFATSGS